MTRIAKLYAQAVAGRSLTFVEFCRLIEAFGYRHVRTTGSHIAYSRVDVADTRIVQPRGKDAKAYQVRQFLDKVETLGLTMDH